MGNVSSLAVTALASALAGAAHGTTAEESRQIVAAALADLESSASSICSDFRVNELARRPIDPDGPWPDQPWQPVEVVRTTRFQWCAAGERFRLLKSLGPPHGTEGATRSSYVWTGEAWYEYRPRIGSEPGFYRIYPERRASGALNCSALFNCSPAGWSFVGNRPLSAVFREDRLVGFEADGATRRFRFATSPDRLSILDVEVELEPWIRPRSVTFEAIGPPGSADEGQVTLRIALYFEQWGRFDGVPLPSRARKVDALLRSPALVARGLDPTVTCTILERDGARRLGAQDGAASAMFDAPAPAPGDAVQDHRQHLVYEIGSRNLFIDGREFETRESIAGLIRDDLATIERREIVAPPSIEAGTTSRATIRHDLGVHELVAVSVRITKSIEVPAASTAAVRGISVSCPWTEVTADRSDGGDLLVLHIVMTLHWAGVRKDEVTIEFADGVVQAIQLVAEARRP